MKIIKYIFILLFLSLIALAIFIATEKGDFTVVSSKIINAPKEVIFSYVKNTKNLDNWYSWNEKTSKCTAQTIALKNNDSITQKINCDDASNTVYWSFKDTIGGTKVVCKTQGKMNFVYKIYTVINGGVQKNISEICKKNLSNLDHIFDIETKIYTTKLNGIVRKFEAFYLSQTFSSKITSITHNVNVVVPKIIDFCKKNNITISGKPFTIYHAYDVANNMSKISICVPIQNAIFTSSGSDIVSGKLEFFYAIKATLLGDYSHKNEILNQVEKSFTDQKLNQNTALMSHLEIYTIGALETKNPSKWVTQFYFPIKPKPTPKKYYKPAILTQSTDSTATPKSEVETIQVEP